MSRAIASIPNPQTARQMNGVAPHHPPKHHEPVRLVHVLDDLSDLGTLRMVTELVTRLDRTQFSSHGIVVGSDERIHLSAAVEELIRMMQRADVDTKIVHPHSTRRGTWNEVGRLLQSIACDILHTHSLSGDFWGTHAARPAHIPLVVSTEHHIYRDRYNWSQRKVKCFVHRKHDAIVAVSNRVKESILLSCGRQVLAGAVGSKIVVIHNGVDVQRFSASVLERVPQSTPVISVIDQLEPERGHEELFRALSFVKHPCAVHIYGEGSLRGYLERIVRELKLEKQVEFKGTVGHIEEVYRQSDLVCLPTKSTGLNYALLEAMAAGCAIIASNIPAHVEVMHDAPVGVLLNMKHRSKVAATIDHLLQHPDVRMQLGICAQQRIAEHYRVEQMVAAYEKLYHSLCYENVGV